MLRRLMTLVLAGLLMTGLIACKDEGNAERVGRKIDKAIDDAKEKLDDLRK